MLFFLEPEGLVGAHAFEFGQHLDLVASRITQDASGGNRGGFTNVTLTKAQRTRVEPIAEDVIVVMPVHSPANPTLNKGMLSKQPAAAKLIIAVHPDQVAQLEHAVAIAMACATVRSGITATEEKEPPKPRRGVEMRRYDPLSEAKRTTFSRCSHESQLFGANR